MKISITSTFDGKDWVSAVGYDNTGLGPTDPMKRVDELVTGLCCVHRALAVLVKQMGGEGLLAEVNRRTDKVSGLPVQVSDITHLMTPDN